MFERSDRLRAGREIMTQSARVEKAVTHPYHAKRRQSDVRIRTDDAEATSSQASVSQIVDPTQHQQEEYQPQYEQT
jgi:hypothetical protein